MQRARKTKHVIQHHKQLHARSSQQAHHNEQHVVRRTVSPKKHNSIKNHTSHGHKKHHGRKVKSWTNINWKRWFWLVIVLACFSTAGYYITTRTSAQTIHGGSVTITDKQLLEQYPGLPVAVARSVNTVVATQQVLDAADKEGIVASGVIVSGTQVLTAAHNVRLSNGTVSCSQLTVAATGLLTGATASRSPVSFVSSNKYGGSADMALLTVEAGDNFRALPKATLAKRSPEVGETVYFVNFQPTADGKIRTPTSQASNDPATDYSKPAIFSGIVTSVTNDDIVVATGAGTSYGLGVKDNVVRKGASGGAVVNNQGELVGLSVSSDSLQTDRTAASIAKEYGQNLPEHQYQIAHIEPVAAKMLEELETSLTSCE